MSRVISASVSAIIAATLVAASFRESTGQIIQPYPTLKDSECVPAAGGCPNRFNCPTDPDGHFIAGTTYCGGSETTTPVDCSSLLNEVCITDPRQSCGFAKDCLTGEVVKDGNVGVRCSTPDIKDCHDSTP